jgi:glycosyltransferase involved in cell wall biosynthesis
MQAIQSSTLDQPIQTHNELAQRLLDEAHERGWEVPTFNLSLYREARSRYCLVIPLINEGARIHSLLKRIAAVPLNAGLDVILADGGSRDGSLTPDALAPYNLTALITKTGSGKLSSQLRCAYAFALLRGYEGVITIDGNDKDDPTSLPLFTKGLNEGYDFLQASRFVRGGVAENTPLARWLAIRLIHAPMLSLASGFHWTDTTQGYRAYSARMLEDPNLGIFRDIFQNYDLLAYLSYRAPKLKYRCAELPTRRHYPGKEATPTKISFWRGNLNLLQTLWNVCRGKLNPNHSI